MVVEILVIRSQAISELSVANYSYKDVLSFKIATFEKSKNYFESKIVMDYQANATN